MGLMKAKKPNEHMTNEALKNIIGSWFPNPEFDTISEVVEKSNIEEGSEENIESQKLPNLSLLEFTEEESQFLNIIVQPKDLHSLMSK